MRAFMNYLFGLIMSLFLMTGCETNSINEQIEKCDLTPLSGPCKAVIPKYYFDQPSGTCKEFFWGGCGGVVPFNTLEECCECSSSACSDVTDLEPIATILFVGNSLTYTNNLPELVSAYGTTKGVYIETEMLTYPNYALEDHWNDGKLQDLISSQRFNYVVVQQGPSSQADGRISLLEYGAKIKELCTQNGAQLAFFMVWPAKANYYTFDGVIANHTNAAIQTESILCPVGIVWKEHFDTTNDFSYYGPDQFHPSIKGSEVAAEIIYNSLL